MNGTLRDILQNPVMLGGEGQFIVVDELVRQTEPSAILERLPSVERARLYTFLMNGQSPGTASVAPEVFHGILSEVGQSIDFKSSDSIDGAAQAAIGRAHVREKQEVPEDNKGGFDGYQNSTERFRQLYLAYVVSTFLPQALKKTPGDFIRTNLSETEQGALLALLRIKRSDGDSTVQNAMNNASENIKLTPTVWSSFQATCVELDRNPSSLTDRTSALVDGIVDREIRRLSPSDIAQLDDQQASRYLQALGWGGAITPSFRVTQLHFYQNLSPTKALKALREKQIDSAVDHFAGMNDEQFSEWKNLKEGWTEKSKAEKTDALTKYVAAFGALIGTPRTPEVSVTSWEDAPAKPKSKANGYFLGWQNTTVDDKPTTVWTNKIVLIDDIDDYGRPLSVSRSLRSALSTGTHETLHSDDEQKIVRLGYNESKFNTYAASFEADAKPTKIQLTDPLGYTAAALHWTSVGRTTYVSSETNFDLYRQQPFEKYAWSFQNEFAAALNGALVFHQVEASNRVLHNDLRSLFQKVGQVLAAREDLTGDSSDIVPLKNYERAEHPFGALTVRDGETIENGVPAENNASTYVSVDFSKFNGRAEVLNYLQNALKKLDKDKKSSPEDYIPLFKQSADFLIQMPSEIWAIKKKLGAEDAVLASKLDGLALKTQELGEDLSDYSFFVTRKKEIETRTHVEVAQRAERQKVAAHLAATL